VVKHTANMHLSLTQIAATHILYRCQHKEEHCWSTDL